MAASKPADGLMRQMMASGSFSGIQGIDSGVAEDGRKASGK